MATTTFRPASPAQFAFIKTLVGEKVLDDRLQSVLDERRQWAVEGRLSTQHASNLIDLLKEAPRADRRAPEVEATEGMHRLGEDIYKVQRAVHGSGNLYAKRLTGTRECEGHESTDGPIGNVTYCTGTCRPVEETTWRFEYAPGALRLLSQATLLTLEEAKEFGALYGTCCVCGRTLTNEDSIAEGIGPVCRQGF